MQPDVEILMDTPMGERGRNMLQAMLDTAPGSVMKTTSYFGKCDVLMVYGAGEQKRQAAVRAHQREGRKVVMFDMGYWGREDDDMRVGITTFHPTPEQIAASPIEARREIVLSELADPHGPIILIGNGTKSAVMLGQTHLEWERNKLAELRRRFPGRDIVWRPKGRVPTRICGLPLRHGMEIEDALQGCSLVVCRYSNVAVNACHVGVPVECEGGAAYALYRHGPRPTVEQRRDFLNRLSWWNYKPAEASLAWQHIWRML